MRGKIVVITGASGGIGAAVAELLGRRGASVGLVARREDALSAAVTRAGEQAFGIVGDMSRREEVRRVAGEAIRHFGHVDVWLNNVGRGISRVPSELTDDDIDDMMQINVKSALYGMQEILPHFKERGTGHLINISSMLGRIPSATFRSAYSGAKHFLGALTTNFRAEIRETHPGIQVSLVSPGVVFTDFGKNSRHGGPASRAVPGGQEVEEAAAVIVGVIEFPRPDVYTRSGSHDRVVDYFDRIGVDP
jgi:short-subunit dehydrogenase